MPVYEYRCDACESGFERILSVSQREAPLKQKCPQCGKKRVTRAFITPPVMGVDATKGAGSDFKQLINKIKRGQPKSTHEKLDQAASLRGRKYGAQ